MTSRKQLKARIRARMAKTGERYAAARASLVGQQQPVVDHGWTLHGGCNPESAAWTALLQHAGIRAEGTTLDEPLLFGISGGIGAGYILWEFKHDDSRVVTLGFTNEWQYSLRPSLKIARRLGLSVDEHTTGGAKGAAKRLDDHLAADRPCLVWPDRYHLGYWQLPSFLDGRGGHPVVAYASTADSVRIDDRNLEPLTVSRKDFDASRARVGSYRNMLLALTDRDVTIDEARLREAVLDGLREVVGHLSSTSDSFSLPAWRKWSRVLVDPRNAKSWPKVFADRVGLFGALLSVWEGVAPAGMTGGHHRTLFADFLDRAATLLGRAELAGQAATWREIAARWHDLGEAALPVDVPAAERARVLTATVTTSVGDGDAGAADREEAATELWELRTEYATRPPFDEDRIQAIFGGMSTRLADLHEAETAAIAALARTVQH